MCNATGCLIASGALLYPNQQVDETQQMYDPSSCLFLLPLLAAPARGSVSIGTNNPVLLISELLFGCSEPNFFMVAKAWKLAYPEPVPAASCLAEFERCQYSGAARLASSPDPAHRASTACSLPGSDLECTSFSLRQRTQFAMVDIEPLPSLERLIDGQLLEIFKRSVQDNPATGAHSAMPTEEDMRNGGGAADIALQRLMSLRHAQANKVRMKPVSSTYVNAVHQYALQ